MAFHWKNGWFFKRLPDGSVHIFHSEPQQEFEPPRDVDLVIDSSSWASIVASVSCHGETGETFGEAIQLHQKPK